VLINHTRQKVVILQKQIAYINNNSIIINNNKFYKRELTSRRMKLTDIFSVSMDVERPA